MAADEPQAQLRRRGAAAGRDADSTSSARQSTQQQPSERAPPRPDYLRATIRAVLTFVVFIALHQLWQRWMLDPIFHRHATRSAHERAHEALQQAGVCPPGGCEVPELRPFRPL
jgi:hypothetical protein